MLTLQSIATRSAAYISTRTATAYAAVACLFNVHVDQITAIEEWADCLYVAISGIGNRFVSKSILISYEVDKVDSDFVARNEAIDILKARIDADIVQEFLCRLFGDVFNVQAVNGFIRVAIDSAVYYYSGARVVYAIEQLIKCGLVTEESSYTLGSQLLSVGITPREYLEGWFDEALI